MTFDDPNDDYEALEDEDLDEHDDHMPCEGCSDEHPEGVLQDGLCPTCCDEGA